MDDPIITKILVVGDSNVGKTSIIQRFINKSFNSNQPPTIGCDFATKVIKTSDGNFLKLQLWDVAGSNNKFKI